jgi:hypothetical protein
MDNFSRRTGSKLLHDYLKYIFGTVFKHIEISVEEKLDFKAIPKVHKLFVFR